MVNLPFKERIRNQIYYIEKSIALYLNQIRINFLKALLRMVLLGIRIDKFLHSLFYQIFKAPVLALRYKIVILIYGWAAAWQKAKEAQIFTLMQKREKEWRDQELSNLQRRSRRDDDIAIVERLMHANHERFEVDEKELLERVYGKMSDWVAKEVNK